MVFPRGICPGLRPSRIEIRFSCAAICAWKDGNRGERLLVLRADLHHLRLRHDAGPEAQVEDARGLAEVRRRGLGDLQLAVERAQPDVARSNGAHHRQHDPPLRLLARVDLRLRGLAQPADPTEEVELPGRAQRRLVQAEIRIGAGRERRLADPAGAGAGGVRTVADLGEQLGACRVEGADELLDARGSDAYVAIFAQRRLDQFVEHRVAKLLPPLRVGDIGGLRIVDSPGCRRIDGGTHVVRSDGAAREGNRNERCKRTGSHLGLLAVMRRRRQTVRCISIAPPRRSPRSQDSTMGAS